MATVGLLGIPIVRIAGEEMDSSLTPFCIFTPGVTDKPRKDLEQLLIATEPEITVADLGELTMNGKTVFNIEDGFIDYNQLGFAAKKAVERAKADVVVAVGGDHAAAFPLYFLPGHVVRADAHGDAYVLPSFSSSYTITGATYMFFVAKKGMKRAEEVWNVGVEYFASQSFNRGVFGDCLRLDQILRSRNLPKTGFVDIDVDVLKENYRLPHCHSTSNFAVEDLAQLVIKLQPNIVGLFECVNWIGAIPQGIVSDYPNVFGPVCKAVAEAAVARALAAQNGAILQTR